MNNLATEEMTDCARCRQLTFDEICGTCRHTPLWFIHPDGDDVLKVPFTSWRWDQPDEFYRTEHDALNAVINRIFARMSADGDKLSKHVERRKAIEANETTNNSR